MQKDIRNTKELNKLTEEFRVVLGILNEKGLLRHALAAMALAMQEEITHPDNWRRIANGDALELILRGLYSAFASDGEKDIHAMQKLSLGYSSLMCSYHEDRREEIAEAFGKFRKVLE